MQQYSTQYYLCCTYPQHPTHSDSHVTMVQNCPARSGRRCGSGFAGRQLGWPNERSIPMTDSPLTVEAHNTRLYCTTAIYERMAPAQHEPYPHAPTTDSSHCECERDARHSIGQMMLSISDCTVTSPSGCPKRAPPVAHAQGTAQTTRLVSLGGWFYSVFMDRGISMGGRHLLPRKMPTFRISIVSCRTA